MWLELVPGQEGRFDPFADFLQGDFPQFVLSNPSVYKAMERYGMFLAFEPGVEATEREKALRLKSDANQRRRIIFRSLVWGLPPNVLVMSGSSSDFAGFFNPRSKKIAVDKDLVQLWQCQSDHKNLSRLIRAVLVHELVHYYNDVMLPGTTLYSKAVDHLDRYFSAEAYGPLGWDKFDYIPLSFVMDTLKSDADFAACLEKQNRSK